MKKITTAIALTLAALSLSACNEGHAKTQTEPKALEAKAPSVGQQLIDLKRAAETGAMTQDEYLNAKSKILSSNLTNNQRPALVD